MNTRYVALQTLISTGEIYLKRAARIADKSDEMEWRDRAQAQLALADYYTYVESQNRSRRIYKEVWDLLSTDEERLVQRDEWFKDPVAVRTESLPNFTGGKTGGGRSSDDLTSGRIVVDYSVSMRGRVRDLRTEAFPPEYTDMQRMVHREVRRRVHRPRLVDGVPVYAEDLRFEHVFSYSKADLQALRDAKAKTGDEQKQPDSD